MSDEKLEFGRPPKAFKKVKDVTMFLARKDGEGAEYRVGVWLRSAGDPMFGIVPPQEFVHAWNNHRQDGFEDASARTRLVSVQDGIALAPTFDGVTKMIECLSGNYAKHLKNLLITKVIHLYLELLVPHRDGEDSFGQYIKHNAPSFSSAALIVGISSEIMYEINGRLYRDTGGFRRQQGAPVDPVNDLQHMSCKGVTVPYSDAAWATVRGIERTLANAAALLLTLGDKGKAQALLEGGLTGLLEGPKA